jgi:hypothetical protein
VGDGLREVNPRLLVRLRCLESRRLVGGLAGVVRSGEEVPKRVENMDDTIRRFGGDRLLP